MKVDTNIFIGDTLVRVTGTFDKGHPGRLSGPPERCYPPEDPSIEIETAEIILPNGTWVDLCQLPSDIAAEGLYDRISLLTLEKLMAEQADDQEDCGY